LKAINHTYILQCRSNFLIVARASLSSHLAEEEISSRYSAGLFTCRLHRSDSVIQCSIIQWHCRRGWVWVRHARYCANLCKKSRTVDNYWDWNASISLYTAVYCLCLLSRQCGWLF